MNALNTLNTLNTSDEVNTLNTFDEVDRMDARPTRVDMPTAGRRTPPGSSYGLVRRLVLGAALALAACSSTPPGLIRVTTEPSGANIWVPRIHLEGKSPYEFSKLEPSERIVISLEGYREFTGRIDELPMVSEGHYRYRLESRR